MNEHEELDKKIETYISAPENKEKVNAYTHWLAYFGGFSGQGTTALDIEPDVPMPDDLPSLVRLHLITAVMKHCGFRARTFRQVMMEQLGEDFGEPVSLPERLNTEFETVLKEANDVNSVKRVILDELDIVTSRMTVISNSVWLTFKAALNGELGKLRKKADLLFEEFDRLDGQQTGVKN